MNRKSFFLTAIKLGLVIALISACSPASTPQSTPTATPIITEAMPTITGAEMEPTQDVGVGLLPHKPTQEPPPLLTAGEVITPENASELRQLDYRGRGMVSGIAWAPDGAQIAVASSSGIYLVDTTTYKEKRFSDISSSYVAFSPDGSLLASAEGSAVSLWDIATGKSLRSLEGHTDMIYSIAFSPDGKMLVSGSQDGTVRLWEVASGKELSRQPGTGTFVYQVAFLPDGKRVVSLAYEEKIVLWDVSNPSEMRPASTYSGTLMALSPDQNIIATANYTEAIELWDISNGSEVNSITGHTDAISALAFSPDGRMLASASYDTMIRLSDVKSGQAVRTLTGNEEGISSLAFAPDGTRLASASQKTIKIWEVASGQVLYTSTGKTDGGAGEGVQSLSGYGSFISTLAFSPDGELLATGGESGPVKLYKISTGELLGELAPPVDRIVRVTFSRDSKLLAVAYNQYVPKEVLGVQIWDVTTQTPLVELNGFVDGVFGVDFSPDGTILATSGGNPWGAPGFVKLWKVSTGELILDSGFTNNCTYVGSCNPPFFDTTSNITFNPDGSLLTGANSDGSIHLYDIAKQKEVLVFQGVGGYGSDVAFSPDGKLLATSGSANNTDGIADLKLWEVNSGKLLFNLKGHSQAVTNVAFSPNGQVLASSSVDGTVRLWDVTSGNSLRVLEVPWPNDIAFNPDGTLLATSGEVVRLWGIPAPEVPKLASTLGIGSANDTAWSQDGRTLAVGTSAGIALYDTGELKTPSTWHASTVGSINSLAFGPDSHVLAVAGWEGLVIWNLIADQEQGIRTGTDAFGVAFSPDGKFLAAGSYENDVQIWDVATGKSVIQLKGGDKGILEVIAFSPDGKAIASASSNRTEGHSDGKVRLWDVSTGKRMLELGGSSNSLAGVAFSPDGKTLATGGPGSSVSLWDLASGKLLKRLEGYSEPVVSVAFSPDGLKLASLDSGKDNRVHVWDIASSQSLATLEGCPRTDYANQGRVDFSPDGSRLAIACEDAGVTVWDVAANKVQHISQGNSYGVSSIAFSPNGSLLASGHSRNWDMEQPVDIILWNLETMNEQSRLAGQRGIVNAVAFNPNGNQLASGGIDGTARFWDLKTGASKIILEGYPLEEGSMMMYGTTLKMYPVSSLAYSPDGSVLAVGGGHWWIGPGWLELYDTATGKQLAMREEQVTVSDIDFSPDGAIIATSNEDGTVRLWDAASGKELLKISDDTHYLSKVAFSPDGKFLAASELWNVTPEGENMTEEDIRGGVHFWNVASGEKLDLLDVGQEPVRSIAFSPDGKLLAVGHDRSVALWEMQTGKQLSRFECGDFPVITFSPDGTLFAFGDTTGVIQVWRLPDI